MLERTPQYKTNNQHHIFSNTTRYSTLKRNLYPVKITANQSNDCAFVLKPINKVNRRSGYKMDKSIVESLTSRVKEISKVRGLSQERSRNHNKCFEISRTIQVSSRDNHPKLIETIISLMAKPRLTIHTGTQEGYKRIRIREKERKIKWYDRRIRSVIKRTYRDYRTTYIPIRLNKLCNLYS